MRPLLRAQVPTTVMATVDSSVGGKTGVNHPLGKNMIGAFYQPQLVLVDTATLHSLPDRELASGVSEIVKYGLIHDAPLFAWLEANMHRLLGRDEEVLPVWEKSKAADHLRMSIHAHRCAMQGVLGACLDIQPQTSSPDPPICPSYCLPRPSESLIRVLLRLFCCRVLCMRYSLHMSVTACRLSHMPFSSPA